MIRKDDIQKILEDYPGRDGLFVVELRIDRNNRISLFIDRMEGITIEECVKVSRLIEHSLDREKEDFELMVSSPGLDMPFQIREQYLKNIGKRLKIKLEDNSEVKGRLAAVTKDGIVLEKEKKEKKKGKRKKTPAGTEEKEYAFDEIQQAKLIIEFK
jgi:ribosome maturation factor RimP